MSQIKAKKYYTYLTYKIKSSLYYMLWRVLIKDKSLQLQHLYRNFNQNSIV